MNVGANQICGPIDNVLSPMHRYEEWDAFMSDWSNKHVAWVDNFEDQSVEAEKLMTFENVRVRWEYINGHPMIIAVLEDGKMLNLSNKYFGFFHKLRYYPDADNVAKRIKQIFHNIVSKPVDLTEKEIFYGSDALFHLPSHHYEDTLHKCWQYKQHNLTSKFLAPQFEPWFINQIEFFRDWCLPNHCEVFWLPQDKTVMCSKLEISRFYHYITEGGRQVMADAILKILDYHQLRKTPVYDKIMLMKFPNAANASNHRSFNYHPQKFEKYLAREKIKLIQGVAEHEKIWHLITAKTIVLSWGANSHINFHMVLGSNPLPDKKNILILGHKGYDCEYIHWEAIHPNVKGHRLEFINGLESDAFNQLKTYQEMSKFLRTLKD